jgi:hypothetical protein
MGLRPPVANRGRRWTGRHAAEGVDWPKTRPSPDVAWCDIRTIRGPLRRLRIGLPCFLRPLISKPKNSRRFTQINADLKKCPTSKFESQFRHRLAFFLALPANICVHPRLLFSY